MKGRWDGLMTSGGGRLVGKPVGCFLLEEKEGR